MSYIIERQHFLITIFLQYETCVLFNGGNNLKCCRHDLLIIYNTIIKNNPLLTYYRPYVASFSGHSGLNLLSHKIIRYVGSISGPHNAP